MVLDGYGWLEFMIGLIHVQMAQHELEMGARSLMHIQNCLPGVDPIDFV
jgi:hypothetical protein